MPDAPDFRADKSESTEGQRVAAGRWGSFHYSLDEDVVAEAYSTPGQSMEDLPPTSGTTSPPTPSSVRS
jgi:hypothetical protein